MADTSPFTQHGSRYAYIKSEFTRGRVVIHPPIHCATSEQIIACVSHDLARTSNHIPTGWRNGRQALAFPREQLHTEFLLQQELQRRRARLKDEVEALVNPEFGGGN